MTKETITIGGRKIPMTKDGLPNMIFLTKGEREAMKEYKEKQKREKLQTSIDDIKKLFEKV
jgi:hypothetical protein